MLTTTSMLVTNSCNLQNEDNLLFNLPTENVNESIDITRAAPITL